MVGPTTAVRVTGGGRLLVHVGALGLWLAHACCLLLLVTLAWGPHWPFSRIGIVAPPAGLINAGFDLADLLLVGILAGWAAALMTGRDRVSLLPRWICGSLLVFALAAGLSVLSATDRDLAIGFAVRACALAVLYLYLYRGIATRRLTAVTIARLLAPGLGLNGLLAIAQVIHQNPLGLRWLSEPSMYRSASGTAVVLVHGTRVLRPYGVLPHANVLGGILAAALPLVAGLFVPPRRSWGSRPTQRTRLRIAPRDMFVLMCAVLMTVGLLISLSRSAWLGMLSGIVYLIMWRSTGRRRLLLRALLVGAAVAMLLALLVPAEWEAMSGRLLPTSNQLERNSITQRLSLLELSFTVISRSPLTGVGGDNFALAADRFLPASAGTSPATLPVHNTYLLAQAELGPLGATSWLALMLTPLLGLARFRWRRRAGYRSPRGNAARAAHQESHAGVRPPEAREENGSARRPGRGWRSLTRQVLVADRLETVAPREASPLSRWRVLAGCSLMVVAVAGLFDFYIWVNEPVAVLWIVALALFTASD